MTAGVTQCGDLCANRWGVVLEFLYKYWTVLQVWDIMFNVPNMNHKITLKSLWRTKKSVRPNLNEKKYDNGNHWHVGSHVQISREVGWGFCTNTRQSCKYETTTSMYLMSTPKITLQSSWRTENFIGPNFNKKKYNSRSHTHVGNYVQISEELRWVFCTNTWQLCIYETTCSMFLIWTTKMTLQSTWKTKKSVGPSLNEKNMTEGIINMRGTMCKEVESCVGILIQILNNYVSMRRHVQCI